MGGVARGLAVAAASMLGACGHPAPPAPLTAPLPPLPTLSLEQVQQQLGQAGFHVYDANPREMYDRGHVPGATWVDWNHVAAADLPADRGATLVFYCANEWCSASHESAREAVALGYSRVRLMPAGIFGWKKSGRPLESKRPVSASTWKDSGF